MACAVAESDNKGARFAGATLGGSLAEGDDGKRDRPG